MAAKFRPRETVIHESSICKRFSYLNSILHCVHEGMPGIGHGVEWNRCCSSFVVMRVHVIVFNDRTDRPKDRPTDRAAIRMTRYSVPDHGLDIQPLIWPRTTSSALMGIVLASP